MNGKHLLSRIAVSEDGNWKTSLLWQLETENPRRVNATNRKNTRKKMKKELNDTLQYQLQF